MPNRNSIIPFQRTNAGTISQNWFEKERFVREQITPLLRIEIPQKSRYQPQRAKGNAVACDGSMYGLLVNVKNSMIVKHPEMISMTIGEQNKREGLMVANRGW